MNYSGVELDKILAKRDREIVRLREEVKRLQLTLQEVQMNTANYISHLQQQLANKTEDVKRLEGKLQSHHDYERMKKELRILKERNCTWGHSTHVSLMSSHASEGSDSDMQGELSTQIPENTENNLDAKDSEVEIKRKETPKNFNLSIHSYFQKKEQMNKQDHTSGINQRLSPSPSDITSQPALPHLCIKSENGTEETGPLRVDVCHVGENEVGDGQTIGDNTMDGSFLKDVENQQVQDLLQKHNSQHMIGHNILDLLHGSISEILARPKPWCQLTSREKEHFQKMISPPNPTVEMDSDDTIRNILEHAKSGLQSPNGEVDSDDTIKNILQHSKRELQSQSGVTFKVKRSQLYQISHNGSSNDKDKGRRSEDVIRHILEQAKHEMQVQSGEDHDSVMTSDLQVQLEEEKRNDVDHFSASHDLLNVGSPVDFVQEIIRKVKSEIVAEGTCSSSSASPGLCSLKPTISCPLSLESHLSETNQDHSLSKEQDKWLLSIIRCDKKLEAVNRSVGKDYCGETMYSSHQASESYKENCQPSQVQDGQSIARHLSHQRPEIYGGLDIQQLINQIPELDTLSLTRRVKEILLNNNLGQQLFGEKVLALSQGSVSDLLSRPKPWSQLSRKGKEPFLRMYIWLKDPRNVEQLKTMKRSSHRGLLNISKRARVVLTDGQKQALNSAYQLEPYPSLHAIHKLASHLGLQHNTVANWFNNHRSRLRHSVQDGRSASTVYNNSHVLETDLVTQCPSSDSKSCSSPSRMDTSPAIIKQEASDIEISDVRGDVKDIFHELEYVSTGVQSCRNLKKEDEEDTGTSTPRVDDGNHFGYIMVKELY